MVKTQKIVVSDEKGGQRLDVFLVQRGIVREDGTALSRGAIARAINTGQIILNDKTVKPKCIAHSGDMVSISEDVLYVAVEVAPQQGIQFGVIYEGVDFLIINKPAGLQVHPVRLGDALPTLVAGLLAQYPELRGIGEDHLRPGIVHRLDRDTSGVMVIARTQPAFIALKNLFMQRLIQKQYCAVIHGTPDEPQGDITFPIARSVRGDRWLGLRSKRDKYKGEKRDAHTSYVLRTSSDDYTRIDIQLHTGRTHQIRVHFQALGHPLVGDQLYRRRDLKCPKLTYHLLHAKTLSFNFSHQVYTFSAPLPEQFIQFVENHYLS